MTFLLWVGGVLAAAAVASGAMLIATYVNPYLGAALVLASAGGASLTAAVLRERRERGAVRLRHCVECGASVAEGAGFCPRCKSVRFDDGPGHRAASGDRDLIGREMPVSAYSPDRSGTIGWVDAAPPGMMGEAASATRTLRRAGVVLLCGAALAGATGAIERVRADS